MLTQAFPLPAAQTETPDSPSVSKAVRKADAAATSRHESKPAATLFDPTFLSTPADIAEPRMLRALHVMDALSQASSGLSLACLSEKLHIPKASLMRLLQALENEGYVQRGLGRQTFAPGPAMARLGLRSLQHNVLLQRYRPELSQLVQRLGETCNLTVCAEDAVLYLDRVETNHPLRVTMPLGARVPLHCTASGKLFLAEMERLEREAVIARLPLTRMTEQTLCDATILKAELERIRTKGFGVDNEEFIRGMVAVAVPVRNSNGRCVAAVACHAPTARYGMHEMVACVSTLKLAAVQISAVLQRGD